MKIDKKEEIIYIAIFRFRIVYSKWTLYESKTSCASFFGSIIHITIWPSSGFLFPSVENHYYLATFRFILLMTFFEWLNILSKNYYRLFCPICHIHINFTILSTIRQFKIYSLETNYQCLPIIMWKLEWKWNHSPRPSTQIWTHLVIDHQRHILCLPKLICATQS